MFPRFQPDVFDENIKLVTQVQKVAEKKGCSPAQIAIAWVRYHSGKRDFPVIIPIPGATTAERVQENTSDVTINDAEFNEIQAILNGITIQGDRYGGHGATLMNG